MFINSLYICVHLNIIPEQIRKLAHTNLNRLITLTFTIDLIYLELGPEISREMSCRPTSMMYSDDGFHTRHSIQRLN